MAEYEEHKKGKNLLWEPPIPFYSKETKSNKRKIKDKSLDSDSEDDDDKTKYCTISLKLDPDKSLEEEGNKVTHKIPIFESGTAEEYCVWREHIAEVFDRKNCGNNAHQKGQPFQIIPTRQGSRGFQYIPQGVQAVEPRQSKCTRPTEPKSYDS